MRGTMKHKKIYSVLFLIILTFTFILSGCKTLTSSSDSVKTPEEYEKTIQQLEEEIENLKEELAQYTPPSVPSETSVPETVISEEAANETEETDTALPESDNERKQIVVFGDSIWDSARDETGIAYLLSQYMNADVYNITFFISSEY